jgi:hypothetical protein
VASEIITGLNSALPTGPNSNNAVTLGVFGGESVGFASDVADAVSETFYSKSVAPDAYTVAKGMNAPIPRSIFNEYALFNFRGMYGGLTGGLPFSYFTDTPDNPLMGGSDAHNVSISKIVEFFDEHYPKIAYKYQDFLYLKYYKQIPVNHLITLRRFPTPVNDNIFDLTLQKASGGGADAAGGAIPIANESIPGTQVAGVTAVTYLGETTGNKLDDILKFSYGLEFKEVSTDMESVQATDGGYTQQPFYQKRGVVGQAALDTLKGVTAGTKFRRQQYADGVDRFSTTYANFVIGPVNVVNKTNVRDRGIKFTNDIKLNFEYELKSLNYVNPKIAMIDIISNMLTMSTNNGQFFGGGHRYYGAGGFVASQFGDPSKLRNGDFAGYIGSVVGDVERGFKAGFGDGSGNFTLESLLKGGLKVGKTLLGNLLGGFLTDEVGSVPGMTATKAFISGDPTGDWHLTVGNPLNPIVMMGNMYCDNAVMTLGQGLGYDDFPMEAKFEIDLKHGKPRDKGDIENMFNGGRGRIYASAAGVPDILNLRGIDVATYGSIKAGTVSLQSTMSGAQAGSMNNDQIGNISKRKAEIKSKNSLFTDSDSQYVENVVSLFIDS